jgi:DNA invertase Pin-like site-specific DNA recombinase
MQANVSPLFSLSTPDDSTTDQSSGIDSPCMTKAALYARVSTDAQQKEGTIESQLVELKKQIAAAGHVLAEEYIDDGHTGTVLDRPALNRMRADLKTDRFDRIYFLAADRIAREVEYQRIIVGELLKHGKQITINGKDYEQNPENKLTLTMLDAFAEFERAKIIERTTRGRLHRLRMGEMSSNGHRIYGYHYVKKISTAPATLAINEEQAAVVRSIFEMFASGTFGLVTIVRYLEANRIPTCGGKTRWDNDRIKRMLKNETYAGIRYFNRMTRVKKGDREGRKLIRGQWVYRDPSDWLAVTVPAIVSRELFDKVQARREGVPSRNGRNRRNRSIFFSPNARYISTKVSAPPRTASRHTSSTSASGYFAALARIGQILEMIQKNNALADRPQRFRSPPHRILRQRIRESPQIQHFSDLSRTSSPDHPATRNVDRFPRQPDSPGFAEPEMKEVQQAARSLGLNLWS